MYKCPGCGAPLRFDPASQKLQCDRCQTALAPWEVQQKSETTTAEKEESVRPEEKDGKTYHATVYRCPHCGSQVLSTDEAAVTFCSYCASNVILEERLEQIEEPERIIPFTVSREECESIYRDYLHKTLFLPSYMKEKTVIEKFRGIYMPHWIYESKYDGTIRTEGHRVYRRGDWIITENHALTQDLKGRHKGASYDGASEYADEMSRSIAPYKISGSKEFHPAYMAGFYADISDVPAETYRAEAEEIAADYMAEMACQSPEYAFYGVGKAAIRSKIKLSETKSEKGYFPVWFLSNRTAGDNRITYAVVNGQTGKCTADLPVSFAKYILWSLILAVALFGLFLFLETFSPGMVLAVSIGLSVVSLITVIVQVNKVRTKENRTADKGYQWRRTKGKKTSSAGMLLACLWKPVLALLTGVIIFLSGTFYDWILYGGCIVNLLLFIWSVLDVVRLYNRVASSPVPQFEKRGGDGV